MLQSSNPALSNSTLAQVLGSMTAARQTATTGGVMAKTVAFVSVAIVLGGFGYSVVQANPSWMIWINLIALVATFGVYFGIRSNPRIAAALGFFYAAAEGFLLGGVASMLDQILAQSGRGLPGGVALSAAAITASVTAAMLFLYSTRIVRPSRTLAMVLSGATLGIMIAYLGAFVVSWLLPSYAVYFKYLTLQSAIEGGTAGWIGLGVNVLILLVASFWLVIDFGQIETAVQEGAPRQLEWYLAFGLLVTLAWIYFEALKLAFRLASLVGDRR